MTPVIRLTTTESTNADAMRHARDGASAPLWVVAEQQAGGRGRRGRTWHSPPGNLYASLLLIDPCPADVASQLGFVAGVALVAAVAQVLPDVRIQLKWPNDLLSIDGAKIAGILLEASRLSDGRLACVIGIGVNCRSHPADLAYAATDLTALAGRDVTPEDVLRHLDDALVRGLAGWSASANFAAVREAWLASAAGLGGPVSTRVGDRAIDGTFETIDATGRLVVANAERRVAIDAGDVLYGAHTPTLVSA